MLTEIAKYVENDLSGFNETEYLSFIVGASPSKGARSPVLWNKAFSALRIPGTMLPLDVKEENLSELFVTLKENDRVIGGCVAAPFKESVFKLIDVSRMSSAVSKIGTANNFFRTRTADSEFWAANTDGAAAANQVVSLLRTAEKNITELKELVVLGTGGTSKAVVPHLIDLVSENTNIRVHYHSKKPTSQQFVGENIELLQWADVKESIDTADLIVNCTVVGTGDDAHSAPISLNDLVSRGRTDVVVYDVNYQPSPTKLVQDARKLSLVAADGLDMNLEQAVLAFKNCVKKDFGEFSIADITHAMQA